MCISEQPSWLAAPGTVRTAGDSCPAVCAAADTACLFLLLSCGVANASSQGLEMRYVLHPTWECILPQRFTLRNLDTVGPRLYSQFPWRISIRTHHCITGCRRYPARPTSMRS